MSLRIRFTLLYSLLAGGILLIFGTAVYLLVGILLVNQVDDTLMQTTSEIVSNTHIDSVGELNVIILPKFNFTSNLFVQVWDVNERLTSTSQNIGGYTLPLDPEGLKASLPIYRNVSIQQANLRTLSVPLLVGEKPIGTLQVASSTGLIDSIRQILFYILLVTTLISMFLAGVSSWFVIGQALAPLNTVTETALQISHANDLSRRIPYHGPENDEIGQLIYSFNETLERLDQLFASQQRFLADVSHELRTPLTVIKANADLMRMMKVVDFESLNSIEEETDRLTRMVGDLLLLAQAESGKLPLTFQTVELDTILFDVLKELRLLAGDRVQLKISEIDQVQVNGDPDRLKQVLVNLISNAIKYTPGKGTVTLELSKVADQSRLIIRDTGPGIPAEDLPHIFERFYRAEKSRTRAKSAGFGLGLSIAYWIINNHGGRIEVDSQEDQGTSFTIWLPLSNPNLIKSAD
jgi:two-component system OmpR family sensor kinase